MPPMFILKNSKVERSAATARAHSTELIRAHEAAIAAIEAAVEAGLCDAAFLKYNDRLYDHRGWCAPPAPTCRSCRAKKAARSFETPRPNRDVSDLMKQIQEAGEAMRRRVAERSRVCTAAEFLGKERESARVIVQTAPRRTLTW